MPTRRSTNATTRQTAQRLVPARGTTASDIVGLVVAVMAVAMATALLVPTTAPVTSAVSRFLTLSFGRGALLVPAALILFSGTFFLDDGPLGTRVAGGLALVVTAALSLVSLNAAGEATSASLVVAPDFVTNAGGYVGGGVAWACLVSVGRGVGNVLLVGLLVAGVVICGFSLTGAVSRLRSHLHAAGQRLGAARVAAASGRRRRPGRLGDDPGAGEGGGRPQCEDPDGATTFLGLRQTSVLTRPPSDASATPARRPHPDIDVDVVRSASAPPLVGGAPTPLPVAPPTRHKGSGGTDDEPTRLPSAAIAPAIPDFLRDAAEASAPPDPPAKGRGARRLRSAPSRQGLEPAGTSCAERGAERPGEDDETYELPPLSILSSNPNSAKSASSASELDATMTKLQATLVEFGLTSRVVGYVAGPLVTTFQIEMGEGERVSRITNLEDDIALTLAAESVRIFAPIPATSLVGIEIPNRTRQNVHLGDVLPSAQGGPLEFALGRDAEGRPVTADLAAMPHLLVAGATGSGKSVMINSLIMSLLMRTTPRQVRLILVDPKRVEFSGYNGLPHLYVPVVTEPRQAASALAWAVSEMERRLKVFERAGARNIGTYNGMCVSGKLAEMDNPPEPMPFMVIIIDELADLMMVAGKDVEASVVRIAQLARAAGIHLVLATQRPSANVVTGLIKSNIETRVALSVASGTDSRVILDATGAQRLLGNGDMLFRARGNRTRRVLGCYVSDPEIETAVDFIRAQGEPDYHEEILSAVTPGASAEGGPMAPEEEDDPLVWEAARIVVESQLGSTSGLQRRLKVGYARAGRIMDMLEAKGVVGPSAGSKPRDVLLDEGGLEELRSLEEQYREV